MTPPGHLLSGYLVGDWIAAGREGKTRAVILGVALAAGLAPDGDVLFGLLGGWLGAGLHRSFSHSLAAAVGLGLAAAVLLRGQRRALFAAGFLGVASHIFWDALNVWGVRLWWPSMAYVRGNLVHERDVWALGIVALGAVLAWVGRRRAAVIWLAAAIPGYVGLQAMWRAHAERLVRTELSGRRAEVFPTGQVRCAWIAVSAGERNLAVQCVSAPWSGLSPPVRTAVVRDDHFTRASRQSPAVREFLEKIPFPYAEETPAPDGGVLLVWRDLREAYEQGAEGVPSGLHILLSPQGTILSERHQWWLKLW
jgi:membrane-bound metal-dependent hydrolase YbcI (DUF457 family)